MLRGEVWLAVWPNDPEQKERPLLIISNNLRNQASNLQDIIVAKITSLQRGNGSSKPTNPQEDVSILLRKASIIRCASIYTIEKKTLTRKLTQLNISEMAQVDQCLKTVLDLNYI